MKLIYASEALIYTLNLGSMLESLLQEIVAKYPTNNVDKMNLFFFICVFFII